MTLSPEAILSLCNDWEYFCQEFGYNEYSVAEGGGDVLVELSIEQAIKFGILGEELL